MLHKIANTVRALTVDAVEAAQSGHPGLPLGMADVGALLYAKILRHDPSWPEWPDRDRVVLSGGHGSMWLYSLLHLSGYDLSLDELKNFRQLGSATPGHPEYGDTPGVETTTGPLGQGLANAVGMALAERMLAARFNRPGYEIVGHYTYVVAGDGDLMEGVVAEASSLAGHLGLGRLIVFYDDNDITIDGTPTLPSPRMSPSGTRRTAGTSSLSTGTTSLQSRRPSKAARQRQIVPSLIVTKTKIGWGTPLEGTSKAHSDPMGAEAIAALKSQDRLARGAVPHPGRSARVLRRPQTRSSSKRARRGKSALKPGPKSYPELRAEWDAAFGLEVPDDITDVLPSFSPGENVATRNAAGKVAAKSGRSPPVSRGGSADLHPSTKTFIDGGGVVTKDDYSGRNIHFGVREHGMGAMLNGMQLHGGLRVFGSTFLVFADYMRPTIRLAGAHASTGHLRLYARLGVCG